MSKRGQRHSRQRKPGTIIKDPITGRMMTQEQAEINFQRRMNQAIEESKQRWIELDGTTLATEDGTGAGRLGINVKLHLKGDAKYYFTLEDVENPDSITKRLPEGLQRSYLEKMIRCFNELMEDAELMVEHAKEPVMKLNNQTLKNMEKAAKEAQESEETQEA